MVFLASVAISGVLIGGALWAVKKLIDAVVSLFSGHRDDPSGDLPRPYSRTAQTHSERRPLFDSSQRYHTYSTPPPPPKRGRAQPKSSPHDSKHSYRKAGPSRAANDENVFPPAPSQTIYAKRASSEPRHTVSTPVHSGEPLSINDHESYQSARATARRIQNLRDKQMARKRKAEERGEFYLVDRYEKAIAKQVETIERLNAEASAWIYSENNRPGKIPAGSVDLHNLRVAEAIKYAQIAIYDAERQGKKKLRLIVGQGKHSDGGVSVLKPAVKEDLLQRGFDVILDPENAGVLIVRLGDVL